MTSPIAGDREALIDKAIELIGYVEGPVYSPKCEGVREVLRELRAALLEPVGEGWRMIAVNPGFDALFEALERAQSKGYMPDAMADEWEAFDYREIAASPKSNGGMGS